MPKTTYTPTWKKYEPDMYSNDPKKQAEASDKFLAEREHSLKTDSQAKRWEASRKERAAKDKPQWAKEQRAKEDVMKDIEGFKKELRKGGSFDSGMKPAPGYLLVRLEQREAVTDSGIYVATETSKEMNNVGWVEDVGDEIPLGETRSIFPPCQPGNKIMFKRGAGLEIKVADNDCRFMQFSDVLATFYES